MHEIDVSMAPGCYGIGLLYREASSECRTCPFAAQCGPTAAQQLHRLRAELGITGSQLKAKLPKQQVEIGSTALVEIVPKKVQELLDRFEYHGIRITESLAKRENPFKQSPFFMKVACHMLLKSPHGFSKSFLKMAFMQKLNHTEGTAASHVSQVFQIMKAVGACEEVNGMLKLKELT